MTDSVSISTEQNISTAIPPAFECLLSSNVCPSTRACIDIQSLIHAHQLDLTTLQDDVNHLKQRLADLESRQVQAQETLIQLHKTLAPIRRLPPEILSEIFEHCLDTQHVRALLATRARNREAPLLLGRVCRAWRAVSHTTPRLWQDILINVCDGRYSNALCRDALPVLRMWLAHSGDLPLNLFVLCQAERMLPGLVDFFDIIAAHGSRWKTVHVRVQNTPVIQTLLCNAFSNCTSLSMFDLTDGGQSFSISGMRRTDAAEAEPVRFDLSLAPLRHLSLSLARLAIQDVQTSWTSLTRLFFMQDALSSTTSISDYVSVLRQCTLLKECCITIDSGFRDAPLEPLTLSSLEYLQLQVLREAAHTTQLGDFLGVLDAPRLCTLAIEDSCPRREVVLYHSQLKAFLQAHAKSLRHLRYATNSKWFTSDHLIGWIVETPLLIELEYHLDEESSPKPLLEALTPHVQPGEDLECLLPCLERFFVYWDTTETVAMVGDMIEKRYELAEQGIAQFKHISCKPVKLNMGYECMPPHLLVQNLATRLAPLCLKCGLQVDWEACRYDVELFHC